MIVKIQIFLTKILFCLDYIFENVVNIIYVSKISGKWSILSQEGEIEVKVAHLYVQPSTVLIFFLDLLPTENSWDSFSKTFLSLHIQCVLNSRLIEASRCPGEVPQYQVRPSMQQTARELQTWSCEPIWRVPAFWLFCLVFWPHMQHAKVLGPGIELKPQP